MGKEDIKLVLVKASNHSPYGILYNPNSFLLVGEIEFYAFTNTDKISRNNQASYHDASDFEISIPNSCYAIPAPLPQAEPLSLAISYLLFSPFLLPSHLIFSVSDPYSLIRH
jgi:hypothetical protein